MRPWFLLLLPVVQAALVNKTIDDEAGPDPSTGVAPITFLPIAGWTQGATCDGCVATLDKALVFNHTWHDTTHFPGDAEQRTVTVSFTGTAVYAYAVLSYVLTNLTFNIDGSDVGNFVYVPPATFGGYQYDHPIFSKDGLKNGPHQLVMSTTGNTNQTIFLFDYLVYTVDTDPATSSVTSTSSTASVQPSSSTPAPSADHSKKTTSVGPIVGGVVGGLAVVGVVAALLLFCLRRRMSPHVYVHDDSKMQIEPLTHNLLPPSPLPSDSGRNTSYSYRSLPVTSYAAHDPNLGATDSSSSSIISAGNATMQARAAAVRLEAKHLRSNPGHTQQISDVTFPTSSTLTSTQARTALREADLRADASGADTDLRNEVAELRVRMETLQTQRTWAALDESPPQYDG